MKLAAVSSAKAMQVEMIAFAAAMTSPLQSVKVRSET